MPTLAELTSPTARRAAAATGAGLILASVAIPAAVASYRHAARVFEYYDDTHMSGWLPLTTDGLLVGVLVVMTMRRVQRERVGVMLWLFFILGFAGTIAANLVAPTVPVTPDGTVLRHLDPTDTDLTTIRLTVALWPPITLATTLEVFVMMLRGILGTEAPTARAASAGTWRERWRRRKGASAGADREREERKSGDDDAHDRERKRERTRERSHDQDRDTRTDRERDRERDDERAPNPPNPNQDTRTDRERADADATERELAEDARALGVQYDPAPEGESPAERRSRLGKNRSRIRRARAKLAERTDESAPDPAAAAA